MALKMVKQTPADLVLAVMSSVLPPDLQVIEQATYTRGAWQVVFRIIGESHAISVFFEDTPVLHEVLACVEVEREMCAHLHDFTVLQAHQYTAPDGYMVDVCFDPTPAWALPDASTAGIVVEFPHVYGTAPVTRIQWQATATGVRWWTLHTYPVSSTGEHTQIIHVHSRSFVSFNRRMNCAEHKIAYNHTC